MRGATVSQFRLGGIVLATVLVWIEAPNTGATEYTGSSWSGQAQLALGHL